MNIVAVTACATGIAETYMAAEVLEHCAKNQGHSIKVETQGALGVINALSQQDIHKADAVLLTNDIEISGSERFEGKQPAQVSIKDILDNPLAILNSIIPT